MKKISLMLLLVGMTSMAQIKGNRNIETKVFTTAGLTDLEMGLYANVTIDASGGETMSITADSNILDLIETEIVDGTLKLFQKEWIQASQRIKILIGAPQLKRLRLDVHETVEVNDIMTEIIRLNAINGTIIANGASSSAEIDADNGTVNASQLEVSDASVNISGKGKVIVNAKDYLETNLSAKARLEMTSTPKKVKGLTKQAAANASVPKKLKEIKYVNFKIKNNSWNRNNLVVAGPKADGSSFGYGFSMMPGAVKKERWTAGTKIFKVNMLGLRKLLVTITEEDENKIVRLFQ